MTQRSPFRHFQTSPEIVRPAVMMYIRFPRSLRNAEDLPHGRGIDIRHETVRLWRNRFGPIVAAEIRKRRVEGIRWSHWRWHLDEVFVNITGRRRDKRVSNSFFDDAVLTVLNARDVENYWK